MHLRIPTRDGLESNRPRHRSFAAILGLVAGSLLVAEGAYAGCQAKSPWDDSCQQELFRQAQENLQRQRQGGYGGNPGSKPWYVFCNKTGANYSNRNARRIEIYERPFNSNYIQIAGLFNSEPPARNWVDSNCPTWQCDWNSRCVAAGTGSNLGGGYGTSCPPGTKFVVTGLFGQGQGSCVPDR